VPSCELILVRHAEAAADSRLCGWFDPSLTALGERQVRDLSLRLADEPVDAIYSSPLRRAIQTAAAGPFAPRIHPALREIHCGYLDGLLLRDVQRNHASLWLRNLAQADDSFSWPGGESYVEFRRRVLAAMGTIAAAHAGGRALLFTHAGVISQFLGSLTGIAPACWDPLRPANASVTRVLWDGERGEILSFNDGYWGGSSAVASAGGEGASILANAPRNRCSRTV
jgi:2,3-bisphosphoglycerate-dependent phosphoglycerate mutase